MHKPRGPRTRTAAFLTVTVLLCATACSGGAPPGTTQGYIASYSPYSDSAAQSVLKSETAALMRGESSAMQAFIDTWRTENTAQGQPTPTIDEGTISDQSGIAASTFNSEIISNNVPAILLLPIVNMLLSDPNTYLQGAYSSNSQVGVGLITTSFLHQLPLSCVGLSYLTSPSTSIGSNSILAMLMHAVSQSASEAIQYSLYFNNPAAQAMLSSQASSLASATGSSQIAQAYLSSAYLFNEPQIDLAFNTQFIAAFFDYETHVYVKLHFPAQKANGLVLETTNAMILALGQCPGLAIPAGYLIMTQP